MKRATPAVLGGAHQRPEGVVVDRLAELGIELEATGRSRCRPGGSPRRSPTARCDSGRVAQVALDLRSRGLLAAVARTGPRRT